MMHTLQTTTTNLFLKMGIYKNIKCCHCDYSFTGGYKLHDGPGLRLGVPIIKCPQCTGLNLTRKVPWSSFTKTQRIFFWIEITIYGFITGGFLILFPILIGSAIFGKEDLLDGFSGLIIFGIGSILGLWVMISGEKSKIKEVEAIFKGDEYKSFLMSDSINNYKKNLELEKRRRDEGRKAKLDAMESRKRIIIFGLISIILLILALSLFK